MTATFLIRLSSGITLMWLMMPRKHVTDGFFRIQLRVVLGLTVLCALFLASTGDAAGESAPPVDSAATRLFWLQCSAAAVAYCGSIFWALGRRRPGNLAIYVLALLCGASLVIDALANADVSRVPLQLSASIASALVLGSVLTGMLLGHWYLTSPTMSIRPLRFFISAIAVAAGLRLAASTTAFLLHGDLLTQSTQYVWLGLRVAGAILAPVVVAVMTHQVLKYRNTQSATGILFACLIVIFMGEMSGALLEGELRVPF
jgi:hypothetical protein